MHPAFRNFLLSASLIAVPVAGFTLVETLWMPSPTAASAVVVASPGLGDLSAYQAIVRDTQTIAATGDLAAAQLRITDLETLWDQNATALRQADAAAWGVADGAIDAALSALRATAPDAASVTAALAALSATLDNPVASPATASPATGGVQQAFGIDVTDANGHPLPCEVMATQVRDAFATITPTAEMLDLQSRALERCNADNDAQSDAFAAQALSLIRG